MSLEESPREALVRPRFTDGTFDAPLLLEEHFSEVFLSGRNAPRTLVIKGERGSGLTTAARYLASVARGHGRPVLFRADFSGDGAARARALAESGNAIVFLDNSSTPIDPKSEGGNLLLIGTIEPGDREEVRLAPWGDDELLELLSTPRYVEHRARLLRELKRVPRLVPLLKRPRTARWMVDAAIEIPEGETITLSKLYANFLDTLPVETLCFLREKASLDPEFPADIDDRLEMPESLESLATIFDVETLDLIAARDEHLGASATAKVCRSAPLLLEGLEHFLNAGASLKTIADKKAPERVSESTFPFIVEMITTSMKETLRSWLAAPTDPGRADAVAATLLHACGEKLDLSTKGRTRNLSFAPLDGIDAAGVELCACKLARARLRRAGFERANLSNASLAGAEAAEARFDGAALVHTKLENASLRGASFRGANAKAADFTGADLEGASFQGADLSGARFEQAKLDRADLGGSMLAFARLVECSMAEIELTGADLSDAHFCRIDLTTACMARTRLERADLECCRLEGLSLEGVAATGLHLGSSDLSGASFRGAQLAGAEIGSCRAHDAAFDEADLRGAVFRSVNFHAGSSRSGLLLGKPALEGNMTGFYREGTTDDAWASPESIRAASFRGADLRGARFFDTNLFRVDFRGATLDSALEKQARTDGALLD